MKQECIFYSPTINKPSENPSRNFNIQKILPIDIPLQISSLQQKKRDQFPIQIMKSIPFAFPSLRLPIFYELVAICILNAFHIYDMCHLISALACRSFFYLPICLEAFDHDINFLFTQDRRFSNTHGTPLNFRNPLHVFRNVEGF